MVRCEINDRWPLWLPAYRAARPEMPWWEATRLAAMHHHLREGTGASVIIDVGAEEGDFPALWATWGLRVVLVEPNPRVWPNIRAIWEANELRRPVGMYVGFASDMNCPATDTQDFDSSMLDGWPRCAYGPMVGDHGFRHLAQQTDTTPQMTIDRLVSLVGVAPDAITVDVEGAELRVLRGAHDVLERLRPKVWVSVHPDSMKVLYDTPSEELIAYMHLLDYEPTFLTADHEQHWQFLPRG